MNVTSMGKALILSCLLASVASGQEPGAAGELSFNQDIRPIISNHCLACHGPDEENRKAGIRLDVPGEADLEDVLDRISSTDPDEIMPPPELHKPLTDGQVELLERWVDSGGEYEQHWAFVMPKKSKEKNQERSEIDGFVFKQLKQNSLQWNQRADRRTLIRRLSLDLVGLPPSPEQVTHFLNDNSATAYENLVDRLLASPQFGEHLARYWLDLVRFSDTNGLHHDHYREMSPYRDWVIRSFNDNLPFDNFITWQVAGDLLPTPSKDQLIASGFNRLHLIIDVGTALPEESFHRNVVDRVTAVGTAFMGLTVQCAGCHDHKYDPITQKDFYQLYAYFNNFDGTPETGGRNTLDFRRGLQPPYLELPTDEQARSLRDTNDKIKVIEQEIQQASKDSAQSEQAQSSAPDELKTLTAALQQAQKARDDLKLQIPAAMIMKERKEVRPTHLLVRGQYDEQGELVRRDTPSFLPPMQKSKGTNDRLDLANWLTSPTNPLTSRVTVNRFWQQLFGNGLVGTAADFGAQGTPPSHPELLDYLAIEFVESGWDVKALLRKMVLTKTYQQSSTASPQEYSADPKNQWLARGSRFRLDAEVIRDQVLAATGLLHLEMYGKSVKPPQPEGLWKLVAMPYSNPGEFNADTGQKIYRRSIYTFWKRGLPPPQMTILDAPTRESCIAKRERTNTPLQALLLMNEEQYFLAAIHFADSILKDQQQSDSHRLDTVYSSITGQLPSATVQSQLTSALKRFRAEFTADLASAKQMLGEKQEGRTHETDSSQLVERAAWTMIVHSLFNLDSVRNRE